jgi:hypothetical protein
MSVFGVRRSRLGFPLAAAAVLCAAACAGPSQTATPAGPQTQSLASRVQGSAASPETIFPPVEQPGPNVWLYALAADGKTDPTGGSVETDPAGFNEQPNAFGGATPAPLGLKSRSSSFGGSAGSPLDLTQIRFAGTVEISCQFFANPSSDGYCPSASGANKKTGAAVHAFAAVQSWPFYVGDGASSNLNPGSYTFETTSASGSYIVLAPNAYTFSQPADFQGTSGLAAGFAVVQNGGIHAATSAEGAVTINAQTCASSIYWATMEYFSALGGNSAVEYSWIPPGGSSLEPVAQDVLWGEMSNRGIPVPGQAVTITMGSTQQTLTTDAGGCYGFNLPPAAHGQRVVVSWFNGTKTVTHNATLSNGSVTRLDLHQS